MHKTKSLNKLFHDHLFKKKQNNSSENIKTLGNLGKEKLTSKVLSYISTGLSRQSVLYTSKQFKFPFCYGFQEKQQLQTFGDFFIFFFKMDLSI